MLYNYSVKGVFLVVLPKFPSSSGLLEKLRKTLYCVSVMSKCFNTLFLLKKREYFIVGFLSVLSNFLIFPLETLKEANPFHAIYFVCEKPFLEKSFTKSKVEIFHDFPPADIVPSIFRVLLSEKWGGGVLGW